jgi:hypothetical protein
MILIPVGVDCEVYVHLIAQKQPGFSLGVSRNEIMEAAWAEIEHANLGTGWEPYEPTVDDGWITVVFTKSIVKNDDAIEANAKRRAERHLATVRRAGWK